MLKRRLRSMNYLEWDKVDGNDTRHFRKLVAWLEDTKIRHYTIENRAGLRDIDGEKWQETFAKYLDDVGCPLKTCALDQLEWLLGLAIRLEFDDNPKKYREIKVKENSKDSSVPSIKSINPLDNLDFNSDDFKAGVKSVAELLRVTAHGNHVVTLEACSKLVCERLNATALANPGASRLSGKPYPILKTELGFSMGDNVLNNAAKVLSLLYIQDLRNLQTRINEAIVSIQSITANPKTDTKIGQVGRM